MADFQTINLILELYYIFGRQKVDEGTQAYPVYINGYYLSRDVKGNNIKSETFNIQGKPWIFYGIFFIVRVIIF